MNIELLKNQNKSLFPQFDADMISFDSGAGLLSIPAINAALITALKKRNVEIVENTKVIKIDEQKNEVSVCLKDRPQVCADKVVMTLGIWSIELLGNMKKYNLFKLPIIPHKQNLWYFLPKKIKEYTEKYLPVFAYLDVGIYGHPICDGSPGVKVAFFDPFGAKLAKSGLRVQRQTRITDAQSFLTNCIPGLSGAKMVKKEFGYYQMTLDNEFIVGKFDGYERAFIGAGFCGTGYKFAPVIGKALAQLAFRGNTVYDIRRFNPARFGRIGNLSIIKMLPMLSRFLYPGYWGYVLNGIRTLINPKLP